VLRKLINDNEMINQINKMMNVVIVYLRNLLYGNINQIIIGYEVLFCRFIVKNWEGIERNNKYKELNKVLIKACILYYSKCWIECCEIANDEEKQRT